jgi:hypothetical protein
MQLAVVANEHNDAQVMKKACKNAHLKGLSVLAGATLAALASTATLAADDIAGVTIGSSLAEAKAAIAKANPDYKISSLMLTTGQEAGVTAKTDDRMPWTGTTNAGGPSDEFAALQNESGKVWFIARVQRFDEGGRIKIDALKAALTEKFGKPSSTSNIMGLGFSWQYDRNGKQWFGSGVAPCQGGGGSSDIPGVSVSAPRSFSPNCGKIISVGASTQSDDMVPHYTVSITDAKSMFDELAASDAKAEAERKQKLADEQARAVKPKI